MKATGRYIKKQFCVIVALLLLVSLTANAQIRIPKGYSVLRGYPFVLCCDNDSVAELQMPDSLFNALATGVQFEVNSVEIDHKSKFFTMYNERLLPLLRAQRLYPVKMFIRGAASPEGPYENNRRLGMQRSQNLMRILNESLFMSNGLKNNTIDGKVINEDYAYLVDLMREDNDPDAEAVNALMVANKWDEPACKLALQKMNDGKVWQRLVKDYFPRLRTARVVLCMAHMPDAPQTTYIKGKTDTIFVRDTVYINHTTVVNNNYLQGQRGAGNTSMRYTRVEDENNGDTIYYHPLFALKTNLLFDALTELNASIEIPIGSHFSLSAEVIWPWWVDRKNQWCIQMGGGGLEARYYFRKSQRHSTQSSWKYYRNRPLTGFFMGIHADGAYFDYEWKGEGRQGEAWCGGLTLGGQTRISRYFNFEYSLGLGAARYKYRSYDATEAGDHLWRKSRSPQKMYYGPTKAKLSLVWLIQKKCGKKCPKGGVR